MWYFTIGAIIALIIGIVNVKNEKNKIKAERDRLKEKYSGLIDIEQKQNELNRVFEQKQRAYDKLVKVFQELEETKNILQDEVDFLDIGIYEPHFDFNDSEKFKQVIKQNIEQQKEMIKNKKAVLQNGDFLIDNSIAKGNQVRDKISKLMLKAFNGECDSLIANANWSNISKQEEKIKKIFSDINKLGEKTNTELQPEFLKLKREQLFLCYEYEEMKKAEIEAQKEHLRQIKEEQKVIKEAELARLKAEKEKADFEKALKLAQEQLAKANDEERAKYEAQIAQLQADLKEAEERQQRAISMAQQTKCGHIYIISNIGSFGEDVYKIGMTRRLEPMERVDELGDASVPFKFDVHAMIYSDNAPELENELHKLFDNRRVNQVNNRKEFFRVSLSEIEKAIKTNERYRDIQFKNFAEAKEYRESLAIAKAKDRANTMV